MRLKNWALAGSVATVVALVVAIDARVGTGGAEDSQQERSHEAARQYSHDHPSPRLQPPQV